MGFYSDLMGFYSGSMGFDSGLTGYYWDTPSGNLLHIENGHRNSEFSHWKW